MYKVHFIIPAYNAQYTIKESIKSVLLQRNIDPVIIVVNHDSTDNTSNVIKENFRNNSEVIFLNLRKSEEDFASPSKPLNFALEYLNSLKRIDCNNWFMRLDADDFLCDDYSLSAIIQQNSTYQLIHAKLSFFDTCKNYSFTYGPKTRYQSKEEMLKIGTYAAAHHSMIIRGDLLKKLKEFPKPYIETVSYGEDLDLSLQLFQAVDASLLKFIDETIIFKSLHNDSITENTARLDIWKSMIKIFKRHKNFSRKLLVYLFFDLCFRGKGKVTKALRKIFGYPGLKVGEQRVVSIDHALKRKKYLEDLE